MAGLWDPLTTATSIWTSITHKDALSIPLLDADELDDDSGRRPVHPAVCSKCAKFSKSIARALDRLPPGFDDIFSETSPNCIRVVDVGTSYRTWVNMRSVPASLMLLLYDLTIGPFRPACNLCLMLSAALLWNPDRKDTVSDELRLLRLNTQLVYHGTAAAWEYDAVRRGSPLLLTLMEKDVRPGASRSSSVEARCRKSGSTIVRRRNSPVKDAICQPRLVGPRFDAKMAREWLGYCQNHHRGPCLSNIEMVTGLCLIDCRSRTVVAAPADVEYVALSYCWGQPGPRWFQWWTRAASEQDPIVHSDADSDGIVCHLPAKVPAVISDAMLVTASMGFSYLWVDRYCIDQNNAAKHVQISQMDSIYQKAELTIIAAAGESPSYGLPGVGLRPRRRQLTCSVGDLEFLSTMSHPCETLESSPWFKRAWTFQEGLLSRRRLIFTDEQVYYECAAMNCCESMLNDLDSLHTEDRTKFREYLKSGFFGVKSNFRSTGGFGEVSRTPEDNMRRLRDMIELYTDRDLTYDTDSLNAFVGILRLFEHSESPIATIWGVPLQRSLDAEEETLIKKTDASFVASLAWMHEIRTAADYSAIYPRRRNGFPSWSWCGWQGGVSCVLAPSNSLVRSIALEDSTGALFTLTEYLDRIDPIQSYGLKPSVLWIAGFVVPPSAFTISCAEGATSDDYCIFGFKSVRACMSVAPWWSEPQQRSFADDDSRRCVCLGDNYDHSFVTFLILGRHGSDWERIGYMWLSMEAVDDGRARGRWEIIRDDQPRQFWKSWLDYETKSSVPLDEVWGRIRELPVTSFRII